MEHYTDDGYAELQFYLINEKNETDESLLHITRVNLMATPTMNSLVKRLQENLLHQLIRIVVQIQIG